MNSVSLLALTALKADLMRSTAIRISGRILSVFMRSLAVLANLTSRPSAFPNTVVPKLRVHGSNSYMSDDA